MSSRSATELVIAYVGKRGLATLGATPSRDGGKQGLRSGTPGIEVGVWVRDARIVFGHEHLLITPAVGEGSMWIGADRVRIIDEWPPHKIAIESTGPLAQRERAPDPALEVAP